MAEPTFDHLPAERRDEDDGYRQVEPWSVGALLLGILSPVALLAPLLWLLPPLGVVAGAVALGRVRRDPHRVGRAAALAGLGLSVLFGVLPIARMASAILLLSGQARPVADQFLEYLRQDRPQWALALKATPDARTLLAGLDDEGLWAYFGNAADAKKDLKAFVNEPLVRTLLALGPQAQARYYRTASVGTSGDYALVTYWYTFTFDDEDGRRKTFAAAVTLERKSPASPRLNPWRVKEFFGPIRLSAAA